MVVFFLYYSFRGAFANEYAPFAANFRSEYLLQQNKCSLRIVKTNIRSSLIGRTLVSCAPFCIFLPGQGWLYWSPTNAPGPWIHDFAGLVKNATVNEAVATLVHVRCESKMSGPIRYRSPEQHNRNNKQHLHPPRTKLVYVFGRCQRTKLWSICTV
jgi:hypothetical protein